MPSYESCFTNMGAINSRYFPAWMGWQHISSGCSQNSLRGSHNLRTIPPYVHHQAFSTGKQEKCRIDDVILHDFVSSTRYEQP